jgi:hypothetical protein
MVVMELEKLSKKKKNLSITNYFSVYGVLNKNYTKENPKIKTAEKKSLDHLFVEERKKKMDLDTIRQKAYGDLIDDISKDFEEEDENSTLLYEMQDAKR